MAMTLNLDHRAAAADDDDIPTGPALGSLGNIDFNNGISIDNLPPLPNFNAGGKQLSKPDEDPNYQQTESVI